jgi:uncharacterized protein
MHGSRLTTIVLILVSLLIVLNWYTYQALKTVITFWKGKAFNITLFLSLWAVHIISIVVFVSGAMGMSQTHKLGFWPTVALSTTITLIVTQTVVVFFLFSEDIYRAVAGLVSTFKDESTAIPARRKFISQIALLVASIPFASFVYGVTRGKYNYKVHKHVLTFSDLPEAFNGFKITQISDVHSGSFTDHDAVKHGIELINEQQSDLFLFTGDLVNNDAKEFDPWKELFSKIKAPFGQFSVLGNHDYSDYGAWPSPEAKDENTNRIIQHHADVGFRLMRDEHIKLEKDGQSITLMGVQNWGKGFKQVGDLNKALDGVEQDSFKILMSHDPTHFEHEVKNNDRKIHLTLSGHTHGMQMGVEFPWLKWSPVKYRYPRWAGMYEENGRYLNVNRGFGFIGFSGRVGIWPEITVIELRKA